MLCEWGARGLRGLNLYSGILGSYGKHLWGIAGYVVIIFVVCGISGALFGIWGGAIEQI